MPTFTLHYQYKLPIVNSITDENTWGFDLNSNWELTDTLFYNLYQGVATLSGTYSLTGDITFSGETKVTDVSFIIEDTDSGESNLLFDTNENTAGEMLGKIDFQGHDDANNDTLYATIKSKITDATDASEDGSIVINTIQDGSPVDEVIIEKGIYTNNATGGAQGSGTINATGLYVNGVSVIQPAPPTITKQIFTTNGTWNKPTGCRTVDVIVIGGGGPGAGNGSGNETIGGTSSFGNHCSATGGRTNAVGGQGVGGDINMRGGVAVGVGGNNPFFTSSGKLGQNAQGFGCGGGGALNYANTQSGGAGGASVKLIDVTNISSVSVVIGGGGTSNRSNNEGGAGSGGIVIVKEYY